MHDNSQVRSRRASRQNWNKQNQSKVKDTGDVKEVGKHFSAPHKTPPAQRPLPFTSSMECHNTQAHLTHSTFPVNTNTREGDTLV